MITTTAVPNVIKSVKTMPLKPSAASVMNAWGEPKKFASLEVTLSLESESEEDVVTDVVTLDDAHPVKVVVESTHDVQVAVPLEESIQVSTGHEHCAIDVEPAEAVVDDAGHAMHVPAADMKKFASQMHAESPVCPLVDDCAGHAVHVGSSDAATSALV